MQFDAFTYYLEDIFSCPFKSNSFFRSWRVSHNMVKPNFLNLSLLMNTWVFPKFCDNVVTNDITHSLVHLFVCLCLFQKDAFLELELLRRNAVP